jgi:hypothetical protein
MTIHSPEHCKGTTLLFEKTENNLHNIFVMVCASKKERCTNNQKDG